MEAEIYKMKYNASKNTETLRILGETFVKNNENKGKIIINNKKEIIKDFVPINSLKQGKIKMILSKNIYNISCLFKDCELLESFSLVNQQNIKDNINDRDNFQIIDNENINLYNIIDNNMSESLFDNDSDYYSDISEITQK